MMKTSRMMERNKDTTTARPFQHFLDPLRIYPHHEIAFLGDANAHVIVHHESHTAEHFLRFNNHIFGFQSLIDP